MRPFEILAPTGSPRLARLTAEGGLLAAGPRARWAAACWAAGMDTKRMRRQTGPPPGSKCCEQPSLCRHRRRFARPSLATLPFFGKGKTHRSTRPDPILTDQLTGQDLTDQSLSPRPRPTDETAACGRPRTNQLFDHRPISSSRSIGRPLTDQPTVS